MALKRRRNDKTWKEFFKFSFFTITSGMLCLTKFAASKPFCYILEYQDESNGHFKSQSAYFKRVECDGSSEICKQFPSREAVNWIELLNSHCLSQENYLYTTEESNQEQPKCPSPLEYNTNTSYYYRYLELPIDTRRIEFEVKANNDVFIALSPRKRDNDIYEIVIGGWSNTKSSIRPCKQCVGWTIVDTYWYLSANEFRKFWITFGNNEAIAVGREDESTPFMKWTDYDPLFIRYLGYSTGWGSSGEFRFCNLG